MTILEAVDNLPVLCWLIIHEDCNSYCSLYIVALQLFTLGAPVLSDNNLTFINGVFLDDFLGRIALANVVVVLLEP